MYRAMIRSILVLAIGLSLIHPGISFAKNGKTLLTLNGVEYSDVDFRHWWSHWNDNKQIKSPSSPSDFVAFQLMVQQGLEMGLDTQPNYLHKLDVFLQVRALMALKYEEIDSKVVITDSDVRKYFNENFSPVWSVQILTFDSESKALRVYDSMLPLKGQLSGQLVFADWYGADVDQKAEAYDEAKVCAEDFTKNKKTSWLPIVRKLSDGEVSAPIFNEENKKYLLIRLIGKKSAGDDVFENKRQKINETLYKLKRNQLTLTFIEKLKNKYNVHIDQELLDSIKINNEYEKEFLDRKVVVMDGFEVTVMDLLYNIKKEQTIRKDQPEAVLKDMVVNSIISQTLVNKESLARGYEKSPPLSFTYEFYKQNRLRLEVEAALMGSIVLTDEDIQKYYDLHKSSYGVSGRQSFLSVIGDETSINKIWLGTLQGSDIKESAQKYSLETKLQNNDNGDIPSEFLAELNKLDKGSVSAPFAYDGKYALTKLIDRTAEQVVPLEQVKNKVVEQLKKERFDAVKSEYLDKLKSKSSIDINERVWNGLVRELGNEKKD